MSRPAGATTLCGGNAFYRRSAEEQRARSGRPTGAFFDGRPKLYRKARAGRPLRAIAWPVEGASRHREIGATAAIEILRLAKEAKVSEIVLRQFLDGERDLRLATAERLMGILHLKLVAQ